jgi:hypothetical protein
MEEIFVSGIEVGPLLDGVSMHISNDRTRYADELCEIIEMGWANNHVIHAHR